MSELHTRAKIRGWSVNQMRDYIVEATELFEYLDRHSDSTVYMKFLRKWNLEEEE